MIVARDPVYLLAFATAMGAVVSCTTAPPTAGYTPNTGIQILSTDIVAGHGCGPGADQVYKYAAVLAYAPAADGGSPGPVVTSGVFDCFADGVFSNLPALDGGSVAFVISVFAYNRDSFPQALLCGPGAAPCPGDDAGVVLSFQSKANWTTLCTVTQRQGVTGAAACPALQPVDGASEADGSTPDGPTQDDSGVDSSIPNGSAGDGSSAE